MLIRGKARKQTQRWTNKLTLVKVPIQSSKASKGAVKMLLLQHGMGQVFEHLTRPTFKVEKLELGTASSYTS